MSTTATAPVRSIDELRVGDVDYAGGKGANLGELLSAGLPVPPAFVIGAPAYAAFCDETGLRDRLTHLLEDLDVEDTAALEAASKAAQEMITAERVPEWLAGRIVGSYRSLGRTDRDIAVAVRSSATGEDTASASFAGMNETLLNVRGGDAVLDAVRACWASLFGSRTIYYRAKRGFPKAGMDIAVVVQRQIASTRAGVMFTIDPSTGDPGHVVIEGSFALGEAVVSGSVSPDRFVVEKSTLAIVVREVHRKELVIEPVEGGGTRRRELSEEEARSATLTDREVRQLTELALDVERHYGSPQDTEWAFDPDGTLWIVQSRPITSAGGHPAAAAATGDGGGAGPTLLRGLGAAPGQASGAVRIVKDLSEAGSLPDGFVLVTHMTAPDWVPLMRKAAAIVTDSGGMTCHAAIVSRELGIPAVVGTGDATRVLRAGDVVTVDATHGVVRQGAEAEPAAGGAAGASAPGGTGAAIVATAPPVTATKLLVNLSEPSQVDRAAALPVDGVGLLRAEMMILEALDGTHPRTLLQEGRAGAVVDRLADALRTFAAGFAPRPITYRTIDFRTNEFRGLRGGEQFEPDEANPMIGYRGALRYTREPDLLGLELEAIERVWDEGHANLHVMLPFVRTERELRRCREIVADSGLLDRAGFELWVMAEVPSVLFNLERYAALGIAGISIGSNDLTQLMLGADRDSEVLADTFDERDPAVAEYLRQLIGRARELGLQTSICGQAPSVHPEYAELLVRAGIDAVSVSVDAVDRTRRLLAAAEQRVILEAARRSDA